MTPMIRNLLLLLASQLVLLAIVLFVSRGNAVTGESLLTFDPATIDRVTIMDGDRNEIELERVAGSSSWKLPAAANFPADSARVDAFLQRLTELEAGPPVARSAEARTRFSVSDDTFERHIVLATGSTTVGELRLGQARDSRHVHARIGNADFVVLIELPVWEVPATQRDWLDQTRVQISQAEVIAVHVDGLRIVRDEATADSATTAWRLTDATAVGLNGEADTDAVELLVQRLTGLRIEGVLDDGVATPADSTAKTHELVLETTSGDSISYRLRDLSGDQDAWELVTSRHSERFLLSTATADAILEAAEREALITTGDKGAEGLDTAI